MRTGFERNNQVTLWKHYHKSILKILSRYGDLAEKGVIDKINIFRPDRVFKFLSELHQQVADASHPRHRSHRLCAIEVLMHDFVCPRWKLCYYCDIHTIFLFISHEKKNSFNGKGLQCSAMR
ncbi:hypothetical protein ABZP36_011216 [Zizania latifolia]